MLKRSISPAGRALFLAGMFLVIVLLAFIGLARLATDAPAPPVHVTAPAADPLAGKAVFDADAVAAERRRDILGALLTFFLLGGAVCAAGYVVRAGVLALRPASAARADSGVEEAFGPLPEPKPGRSQLG